MDRETARNTIIIDFDGTISEEYIRHDGASNVGPPKPHVKEALEKLKELGYIIKIHSCRTATYWADDKGKENDRKGHIQLIQKYLEGNKIPYDEIIVAENLDKPYAIFYIDNRNIRYENNWLEIIKRIENEQYGMEKRNHQL